MRFSSLPEPLSTSTPKWVLTSSPWRMGACGLVGGAETHWWCGKTWWWQVVRPGLPGLITCVAIEMSVLARQ